MAPSSRDRISVDLHGLKAAPVERAQVLGVSPSILVRTCLAEALGRALPHDIDRSTLRKTHVGNDRVRLCLRMDRAHARATVDGARRAGLHSGDYVAGLVADVPVLPNGRGRIDHITALTASSAELATLSRNVYQLNALLRQANVESARAYRKMLDTMTRDVRRHLELAARVLTDLQPRGQGAGDRSSGLQLTKGITPCPKHRTSTAF